MAWERGAELQSLRDQLAAKDRAFKVHEITIVGNVKEIQQLKEQLQAKDKSFDLTDTIRQQKEIKTLNLELQQRDQTIKEQVKEISDLQLKRSNLDVDLFKANGREEGYKFTIKKLKAALSRISECNDLATAREYAREALKNGSRE
jgi:uncharacterized protein (DUF3084 family)